ncbi:MAG: alanine racemase [Alcanivoracaceae bacterium]
MRGTRLELRSESLRHNARRARELAGSAQLFAMIKADGYGHGLTFAARALEQDVDGLGVALAEEAVALRDNGIKLPLLLLEGPFDADELTQAAAAQCELIVHSAWQVALLEATLLPSSVTVWLKVDTGMHRLGVSLEQADAIIARLRACDQVVLAGLVSHFACADMTADPIGVAQLQRLQQLAGRHSLSFSAANSAALFRYPDSVGSRVRPGIMLYGSSPFADRSAKTLGLAVTQRLTARIIAVNAVPDGDTVGYGGRWRAARDSVVAVVAIGYGDGYPRHAPSGTPVAIASADNLWRRAPLVGRVSMDMITVDVTDLPMVRVGDEVELWGDRIDIDEVARHCGTISYELFCRLTARPLRVGC